MSAQEPPGFEESLSFQARVMTVNLFPAEQRIVDHLLAIPSYELGIMTSSDLSGRSGASRSSIDRLSRKLGYPGLKEMRKALLMQEARQASRARADGGVERLADIAKRVMLAIAARSEAMARGLGDNADIDRLVEWIVKARTINLFGAGESAATCSAIYMRLVRLGLPVNFTDEYHTQVTLASLMGPDDLAISVSYSGGTQSTIWASRKARQNGARLVVITGMPNSALAKQADLRLLMPTGGDVPGSAEVLDRIVAAGLGEVLFQCIVAKAPELLGNSIRIDDTFNEARI